jgi:magnesium-transporting ATPase (P-type)
VLYNHKDSNISYMRQKTNDELRDFRVKNDRNEFSKETFEAIYKMLMEREENDSPQSMQVETTKEKNLTLEGFFSFQFMISSEWIQILYIIGAITVTMVCWILFMGNELLMGILSIFVGNLFWRLACEIIILFLRMNEQLGVIHRELMHSSR